MSCVQAVSPIAQGAVQTVSTIQTVFTIIESRVQIVSPIAQQAVQTVSTIALIVQTVSTIITSSAQTLQLEKLTWAWPAKTGRVAK